MADFFRPFAHDVISRRDGFGGWQPHRDASGRWCPRTRAAIDRRSLGALARMLAHAYADVPFYREQWTALGYAPSPGMTLDELRHLPLLTKADIRDRKADLLARSVPTTALQHRLHRRHHRHADVVLSRRRLPRGDGSAVSGASSSAAGTGRVTSARSSGAPMRISSLPGEAPARQAVAPAICDRQTRRSAAPSCRATQMLAYHRRLCDFRPKVIYGYPNAIEQFATFVRAPPACRSRSSASCARRKSCATTSVELFRRVFGGDVFNLYCSREHGCVGFECRASRSVPRRRRQRHRRDPARRPSRRARASRARSSSTDLLQPRHAVHPLCHRRLATASDGAVRLRLPAADLLEPRRPHRRHAVSAGRVEGRGADARRPVHGPAGDHARAVRPERRRIDST